MIDTLRLSESSTKPVFQTRKPDRIEHFYAGETEQAFRAWKTGFVEDSDNLQVSIKEALQNWMIGENARREQLTYMQRHLVKPFEVTPTKFLQRIRIMTALLVHLIHILSRLHR